MLALALALVGELQAGAVTRASRPPQPRPIAGHGYHQVFRDDFNRLNRSIWDSHIWYDDRPSSSWTGFQTVTGGVLHLRTSSNFTYQGGRWPINTMTTLSSGRTYLYGYFEARMRWTAAKGAWPGMWLLSARHARNPSYPAVNTYCAKHGLPAALCWSAELDVFEGQGADPQGFYGTIHRNSCGCYGVDDQQNSVNYARQRSSLGTGWHVYGMLWLPSRVIWYLDGKPVLAAGVYDSTNQPMFLLLQMWTGGWSGAPDATTPDVLETQVDYVDVWQR